MIIQVSRLYFSLQIHELTVVKTPDVIHILHNSLLRVSNTFVRLFRIFSSTIETASLYISVNNYHPLLYVITNVI